MAERRWHMSPLAGINCAGGGAGTVTALIELAIAQHHRARIHAVQLSLPAVDTALAAVNARIAMTSAAGTGNLTTNIVTINESPGAPTLTNEATLTQGHSRTGATEGTVLADLGKIAPQNMNFEKEFPVPLITEDGATARVALLLELPASVSINAARGGLLVEA